MVPELPAKMHYLQFFCFDLAESNSCGFMDIAKEIHEIHLYINRSRAPKRQIIADPQPLIAKLDFGLH
jgi:hypothetical protein